MNGLSAEANVKKGIGTSLRETRTELKKVHWPSRKELTNYTWIVIFSVFIVSLIIYLIDSGLGFIIEKVISL
ncbi:preprotein translocase subunit SecE [Acetoanaerobium noterae]|uniref:preprotein translocase subunit SecE n=1 Tax=Acetoanaerobium noterae TaxID=745369 RepID=UPI003DA05E0F